MEKEKDKEKWILQVKDRLKDYSEPADVGFWANLERDLKRPVIIRRRIMYAAASVVILLGLGLGALNILQDKEPIHVLREINIDKLSMAVIDDNSKQNIFNVKSITAEKRIVSETDKKVDVKNDVEVNDKKELESISEGTDYKTEVIKNIEEANTVKETKKLEESKGFENDSFMPEEDQKYQRKMDDLSFALFGTFSRDNTFSEKEGKSPILSATNDMRFINLTGQTTFAATFVDYKYKYNIPFSFGFSVKKRLTDNFYLESGAFATRLVTSFLMDDENNSVIDTHTLWYIGIPLKVNMSIISKKDYNFYFSAGGAVEKCVFSKYGEYLFGLNGLNARNIPLQWSLNTTLGGQYNISKTISAFFEPGIVYYFDDGSTLATIRKEKPLNINLNAGLRFTIE